jgi:phosphoribosylanthranilate isomerase
MARTRVKICGLTRLEDAEQAVRLGADALGFVFWPGSPRAVSPDTARAISRALPAWAVRVGVFVSAPPGDVARVAEIVGLDVVQLHGDEEPADYERIGRRLIKAVSLASNEAVSAAIALPATVTPLVDASEPARRGGTGQRADWLRAARVARQRPILLAGGLTPENVAEAIDAVSPWAVDVSSGVEAAPGIKSPDRLRAFLRAVNRKMEGP